MSIILDATNAEYLLSTSSRKSPNFVHGEKHQFAILTNEQASQMRTLYESGMYKIVQIARMYNVSHTIAGNACKGKTYNESKRTN